IYRGRAVGFFRFVVVGSSRWILDLFHHRSGYYFFALACLPSRLFIGTTTAAAFIMVSERRALTLF
ncbi:MAG: hypothetical protein ACK44P_02005, partial [Bacteroidota bacterium]